MKGSAWERSKRPRRTISGWRPARQPTHRPPGSRQGGFLIPSNGDDMADLNAEFPAYKTASVASLIPYARNSRTHSMDDFLASRMRTLLR